MKKWITRLRKHCAVVMSGSVRCTLSRSEHQNHSEIEHSMACRRCCLIPVDAVCFSGGAFSSNTAQLMA